MVASGLRPVTPKRPMILRVTGYSRGMTMKLLTTITLIVVALQCFGSIAELVLFWP